ncbi:MAG: hypothetical protein HY001_03495 [Candidatus Portnoybacteria bacterium]|nr:hypothetical protein [Candidatus Portnoybacteria bacterium]
MRSVKIETLKKRFPREWILVSVDKVNKATTTPISGKLILHSPRRRDVYHKLLSIKDRYNVLVEYTEDKFPKGHAAAF